MKFNHCVILTLLLLSLSACGQTGSLYLPIEDPTQTIPEKKSSAPATESQKSANSTQKLR